MKSNTMASTTSNASTHNPNWTDVMKPISGVFEDNALDDVGDVFALVGDSLKQFVDCLEFDHLPHIGLFAKEFAHGSTHDAISIGLKLVDFFTGFQRRFGRRRIGNLGQQFDRVTYPLATLYADVSQTCNILGHMVHVI